jgi:hypothetical protein
MSRPHHSRIIPWGDKESKEYAASEIVDPDIGAQIRKSILNSLRKGKLICKSSKNVNMIPTMESVDEANFFVTELVYSNPEFFSKEVFDPFQSMYMTNKASVIFEVDKKSLKNLQNRRWFKFFVYYNKESFSGPKYKCTKKAIFVEGQDEDPNSKIVPLRIAVDCTDKMRVPFCKYSVYLNASIDPSSPGGSTWVLLIVAYNQKIYLRDDPNVDTLLRRYVIDNSSKNEENEKIELTVILEIKDDSRKDSLNESFEEPLAFDVDEEKRKILYSLKNYVYELNSRCNNMLKNQKDVFSELYEFLWNSNITYCRGKHWRSYDIHLDFKPHMDYVIFLLKKTNENERFLPFPNHLLKKMVNAYKPSEYDSVDSPGETYDSDGKYSEATLRLRDCIIDNRNRLLEEVSELVRSANQNSKFLSVELLLKNILGMFLDYKISADGDASLIEMEKNVEDPSLIMVLEGKRDNPGQIAERIRDFDARIAQIFSDEEIAESFNSACKNLNSVLKYVGYGLLATFSEDVKSSELMFLHENRYSKNSIRSSNIFYSYIFLSLFCGSSNHAFRISSLFSFFDVSTYNFLCDEYATVNNLSGPPSSKNLLTKDFETLPDDSIQRVVNRYKNDLKNFVKLVVYETFGKFLKGRSVFLRDSLKLMIDDFLLSDYNLNDVGSQYDSSVTKSGKNAWENCSWWTLFKWSKIPREPIENKVINYFESQKSWLGGTRNGASSVFAFMYDRMFRKNDFYILCEKVGKSYILEDHGHSFETVFEIANIKVDDYDEGEDEEKEQETKVLDSKSRELELLKTIFGFADFHVSHFFVQFVKDIMNLYFFDLFPFLRRTKKYLRDYVDESKLQKTHFGTIRNEPDLERCFFSEDSSASSILSDVDSSSTLVGLSILELGNDRQDKITTFLSADPTDPQRFQKEIFIPKKMYNDDDEESKIRFVLFPSGEGLKSSSNLFNRISGTPYSAPLKIRAKEEIASDSYVYWCHFLSNVDPKDHPFPNEKFSASTLKEYESPNYLHRNEDTDLKFRYRRPFLLDESYDKRDLDSLILDFTVVCSEKEDRASYDPKIYLQSEIKKIYSNSKTIKDMAEELKSIISSRKTPPKLVLANEGYYYGFEGKRNYVDLPVEYACEFQFRKPAVLLTKFTFSEKNTRKKRGESGDNKKCTFYKTLKDGDLVEENRGFRGFPLCEAPVTLKDLILEIPEIVHYDKDDLREDVFFSSSKGNNNLRIQNSTLVEFYRSLLSTSDRDSVSRILSMEWMCKFRNDYPCGGCICFSPKDSFSKFQRDYCDNEKLLQLRNFVFDVIEKEEKQLHPDRTHLVEEWRRLFEDDTRSDSKLRVNDSCQGRYLMVYKAKKSHFGCLKMDFCKSMALLERYDPVFGSSEENREMFENDGDPILLSSLGARRIASFYGYCPSNDEKNVKDRLFGRFDCSNDDRYVSMAFFVDVKVSGVVDYRTKESLDVESSVNSLLRLYPVSKDPNLKDVNRKLKNYDHGKNGTIKRYSKREEINSILRPLLKNKEEKDALIALTSYFRRESSAVLDGQIRSTYSPGNPLLTELNVLSTWLEKYEPYFSLVKWELDLLKSDLRDYDTGKDYNKMDWNTLINDANVFKLLYESIDSHYGSPVGIPSRYPYLHAIYQIHRILEDDLGEGYRRDDRSLGVVKDFLNDERKLWDKKERGLGATIPFPDTRAPYGTIADWDFPLYQIGKTNEPYYYYSDRPRAAPSGSFGKCYNLAGMTKACFDAYDHKKHASNPVQKKELEDLRICILLILGNVLSYKSEYDLKE